MDTWSCSECAGLDRHLQVERALPASLLMENAGAALATSALRLAAVSAADRVLFVCGPGNNGGDGLVAARQLLGELPVAVWAPLGLPRRVPGDGARAAAAAIGVPLREDPLPPPPAGGSPLLVDALFGTGLCRPLEGTAREAVAWINACGAPVLAADAPSGLDGDSGEVLGAAVRARWTLSFVAPKDGFLRAQGPVHCGEVLVAGIGVSAAYTRAWRDAQRSAG
jgi:hydroxyethylthiazole kinase-like uncharacterized protein yjeF